MAEIQEKDSGKGGKVRSKKNSGKPDMTPMVDLGFLLITFFMFTTTFSKPNMMKLNMPEKNDEEPEDQETSEIKLSNTISIVMGKDDRIFYYQQAVSDVTAADLIETDYSEKGIRAEIMKKKMSAIDSSKFTVILKPTKEATFKNTVDILDEMDITKTKIFAIQNMSQVEDNAVAAKW